MRIGVYLHPKRPKVSLGRIIKLIHSAGATYSHRDPDIAMVVGGDGTFGHYGRLLSVPMLFVGFRDPDLLGSKARLAHVYFEDLPKSLKDIQRSKFSIEERKMLSVDYGTSKPKEILTDVYLERGVFSGCLRYSISVDHKKKMEHSLPQRFTDYAIGNGVIVSTSFGSNGYYYYPDRIKLGKWNDTRCIQIFDDKKIGICHIIPAFLIRKSGHKILRSHNIDSIQYTVPFESTIKFSLTRRANARLYGTSNGSRGVAINVNAPITISPSIRTAKIIRLDTTKK
ncbi:MAG TPA: hypothetical protein VFS97_09070 [Nitrososphaeraceae archaeon]|nr:hypothetical protein [Nitrososphaeraceae archaeon]